MTIKNLLKISDYEIVQLSLKGLSNILPRFTVNYLLNKKSELLLEHAQYFLNHAETRLTFLLSGQHKLSKSDFLKDVSLDDFSILQDYFEKRGGNFYDCVDFKPLLNNLQYNPTLGAHLLNHLSAKQIEDFAFPDEELAKRKLMSNVNLIGITKIKNEGSLPNVAIRNWLELCDHIIVSDASEFLTLDRDLLNSPNITLIHQVKPFHEKAIYDQLYDECRKLKATHILHFDVDEMMDVTSNVTYVRELASKMVKGESLAAAWPQVYSVNNEFYTLDYTSAFKGNSFHRLLPPYKDLIFCDDGHSSHCDLAHHCPTVPANFPIKRFYIDFKMYHLEGLVFENAISKFNTWWDADYRLNQDSELALTRYLPNLLKYLTIIDNCSHYMHVNPNLHSSLGRYKTALQSNFNTINQSGGMRTLVDSFCNSQRQAPRFFDYLKLPTQV